MPNRQLTSEEVVIANQLLDDIWARIKSLAGDDVALAWALRRKVQKELVYNERGKPMNRKILKLKLRTKRGGKCAVCNDPQSA